MSAIAYVCLAILLGAMLSEVDIDGVRETRS